MLRDPHCSTRRRRSAAGQSAGWSGGRRPQPQPPPDDGVRDQPPPRAAHTAEHAAAPPCRRCRRPVGRLVGGHDGGHDSSRRQQTPRRAVAAPRCPHADNGYKSAEADRRCQEPPGSAAGLDRHSGDVVVHGTGRQSGQQWPDPAPGETLAWSSLKLLLSLILHIFSNDSPKKYFQILHRNIVISFFGKTRKKYMYEIL